MYECDLQEDGTSVKKLNERIRDLREDHDLKQCTVAAMLGITQQQYSKYEKGLTDLPTRYMNKLADYYGVTTDYLFGRTERPDETAHAEKFVSGGYSADEMVRDVMALSPKARGAVKEYVELWKNKEHK